MTYGQDKVRLVFWDDLGCRVAGTSMADGLSMQLVDTQYDWGLLGLSESDNVPHRAPVMINQLDVNISSFHGNHNPKIIVFYSVYLFNSGIINVNTNWS